MVIAIVIIVFVVKVITYQKSEYYLQTNIPYSIFRNDKGRVGEYQAFKALEYITGPRRFLFNCFIPKQNGGSTELDIIMLHETGVYVFEVKNYGGWIFGSENQKEWTQTLPNGAKAQKEKFYNPVIQNNSHVKWLKQFIDDESLCYQSYVVFSDRSVFKDVHVSGTSTIVLHLSQLCESVMNKISNGIICLTTTQIEELYNKLYPLTQKTEIEKYAHYVDVQSAKSPVKKEAIGSALGSPCPWCGGKLVLRTAKNGKWTGNQFFGCSNYPKCKYIKNIER